MVRGLAAAFSAAAALAVLAAMAVGWFVWSFAQPGPLPEDTVVEIPRGAGVRAIAERLFDQGVIDDPRLFRWGVRVYGRDRDLRAGEYEFPAGVSAKNAMQIVASGDTIAYFVTIAEGLTSVEIVAQLRNDDRLTGEIVETPAEGTLLPETYRIHRGDDRAELIDRLAQAMSEALDELWPLRVPDLPLSSPQEAVALASIVERETGMADERRLVAGVFVNRLRLGMRLEADPTVIYALTEGQAPLGRDLRRGDLDVESPYNTYRVAGLPPGPIANPGRASLAAVLDPEETDYIFFVADGTGGHAFASTLAEHNRNVAAWRRIRREQSQ